MPQIDPLLQNHLRTVARGKAHTVPNAVLTTLQEDGYILLLDSQTSKTSPKTRAILTSKGAQHLP